MGEFSWNSRVDSMNAVYSKTLILELRHFTFDINSNRTLLSRRVNRVSRWRLVVVKRTTGKQKSEKKNVNFSLHLYICSAQAVTTNFAICFCMKSPSSFKSSVKVTNLSISLEAAMLWSTGLKSSSFSWIDACASVSSSKNSSRVYSSVSDDFDLMTSRYLACLPLDWFLVVNKGLQMLLRL